MFKCPYFYNQYHRGYCRTVQDKVDCEGRYKSCQYPLARNCHEDDMWEAGLWAQILVCRNQFIRYLLEGED